MAWEDSDRGAVVALLAERAEICTMCGHPKSECRDPKTLWEPTHEVCQASRVAQALSENLAEKKQRGVVVMTRRRR